MGGGRRAGECRAPTAVRGGRVRQRLTRAAGAAASHAPPRPPPTALNAPFCSWDPGATWPLVFPALPGLPRPSSQARTGLFPPHAAPAHQPGPAQAPASRHPKGLGPPPLPRLLHSPGAPLLARLPAFSWAGRAGLWGGLHASPCPGGMWGSRCAASHGHDTPRPSLRVGQPCSLGLGGASGRDSM